MRPADLTLPSTLTARLSEVPDRPYLLDVEGRSLSYREAVEEALRWADAYRRLGVGPRDHVVTMQLNSLDAVCGWLGLGWLGAVEAPINIDYRGALLEHVLNNTQARVMLLLERYAERLLDVAPRLAHLRSVIVLDSSGELPELPFRVVRGDEFLAPAKPASDLELPQPWDLGAILYTSGTTGPSKGVMLPWGQIHASAIATFPFEDLGPDDVFYSAGPNYHIGAKVFPYLSALVGGRVVIRPYARPKSVVSDHERFGITCSGPSPALMAEWMARPPSPDDAERPLRNLLVPQPVRGLAEFKKRFNARSYGCFNMTELSIPICDETWDTPNPRSCGKLRKGYPGYEARVVGEHDQEVPPGQVGELVVRASEPWTLNAGYLGMPEATAEAWRNGWFHTGDAFTYDENDYFYFVDRIKDAIRRRAENISSFEVEAGVNEHPAVAASAAIAVKRSDVPGADEEVKIVAVLAPGEALTPEALIEFLIPRMPRFMIPRYVEFVDALPRTPTGKVRKVALRERPLSENTWDREAAGIVLPR